MQISFPNISLVWMTSMHQLFQISKISSIVLYISVVTQHAVTQSGDGIISLMPPPVCVLFLSPLCLYVFVSVLISHVLFPFLLSTAWHKKRSSNAWRTSTRTPWNLHRGRAQAHGPRTRLKARFLRGRSGPVSSTLSCLWPEASSD